MKKQKKKITFMTVLIPVLYLLAGFTTGLVFGGLMRDYFKTTAGTILAFIEFVILFYLAIYLDLIIHEAGHLVFGLATGYRFLSFRIGSLQFQKLADKVEVKRFSLSGTGGQCLMCPPAYDDGNYPFRLYHMGGVLMNVIGAVVFFLLDLLFKSPHLSLLFFAMGLFNLILAIVNGVPTQTDALANDGYNLKELSADPMARRATWLSLKINELQMKGERIKDLPAEWFEIPEDADLHKVLISLLLGLKETRLMDEHRFEEAEAVMNRLLSEECSISGINRVLLELDKVTVQLLLGKEADPSGLEEKANKTILKAMNGYPSVIRSRYAIAKFIDGDAAAQEKLLADFAKCEKVYPSAGEIASEGEILELLKNMNRETEV